MVEDRTIVIVQSLVRAPVMAKLAEPTNIMLWSPWWWSSGQCACLPLRRSEFESLRSLQFFPLQIVFEKKENKQKEARVGPFFIQQHYAIIKGHRWVPRIAWKDPRTATNCLLTRLVVKFGISWASLLKSKHVLLSRLWGHIVKVTTGQRP